jgi:hypothetical protein
VNSVKFAVLPPFFEFNCTGQGDTRQGDTRQGGVDDGTSARVYSLLRDYMVCGKSVPVSVHHIFYFCFALLCYHFDFLKQDLHKKNKLQASHFFTHIPIKIKATATVKYQWNQTEETPTHTGLPPHITILANFKQLMIEMESMKNAILSGVEAELDRRHIGTQSQFDKEEILSRIASMHTKLPKKIDMCLHSLTTALHQDPCFDASGDCVNEIFVNEEEESARKPLAIVPSNSSKKFHFFHSKGQVTRLLNDFVFPHMGLCALLVNWFCRNLSQKTLPLRFLFPADLKSHLMKNEHQNMKVLMGTVITGAQQMGVWDGQNGAWDVPQAMQLYNSVQPLFNYPSLTSTCWNEQISWRTVCNLYINSHQTSNGHGHRLRDWGKGSAGIGEVGDWMDAIEE